MNTAYWARLREAGHKLKEDEGEVDFFVLEEAYCNGPGCVLCGESWCHHCEDPIKPCPNAEDA